MSKSTDEIKNEVQKISWHKGSPRLPNWDILKFLHSNGIQFVVGYT